MPSPPSPAANELGCRWAFPHARPRFELLGMGKPKAERRGTSGSPRRAAGQARRWHRRSAKQGRAPAGHAVPAGNGGKRAARRARPRAGRRWAFPRPHWRVGLPSMAKPQATPKGRSGWPSPAAEGLDRRWPSLVLARARTDGHGQGPGQASSQVEPGRGRAAFASGFPSAAPTKLASMAKPRPRGEAQAARRARPRTGWAGVGHSLAARQPDWHGQAARQKQLAEPGRGAS
jgi:hypothetical protein